MKDYIFFKPPDEVASIKAKLWDAKQAKVYFDWFISVKDDRVEYLLTSTDENLTGNHTIDLKRIGKKVTSFLQKPHSGARMTRWPKAQRLLVPRRTGREYA